MAKIVYYNYHVMVKMKYPDNWQQSYECTSKMLLAYANAWDQKFLNVKVKSWNKVQRIYLHTKSLSENCRRYVLKNLVC